MRFGASKLFSTRGSIFVTETKEAAKQAAEIAALIEKNFDGLIQVVRLFGSGTCTSPTTHSGRCIVARLFITTPGKLVAAIHDRAIIPEKVGVVILDGGHTLLDPNTGSGDHCPIALGKAFCCFTTFVGNFKHRCRHS